MSDAASTDLKDFEQFMRERGAAGVDFVNARPAALGRIVAHRGPATFFGPGGGHVEGAQEVFAQYEKDSQRFESGSNEFEVLHMAASDGLAYWTGFQHATVRMRGKKEEMSMHLRVTEIFRREGMAWKLVHRHADMLTEAKPPPR